MCVFFVDDLGELIFVHFGQTGFISPPSGFGQDGLLARPRYPTKRGGVLGSVISNSSDTYSNGPQYPNGFPVCAAPKEAPKAPAPVTKPKPAYALVASNTKCPDAVKVKTEDECRAACALIAAGKQPDCSTTNDAANCKRAWPPTFRVGKYTLPWPCLS